MSVATPSSELAPRFLGSARPSAWNESATVEVGEWGNQGVGLSLDARPLPAGCPATPDGCSISWQDFCACIQVACTPVERCRNRSDQRSIWSHVPSSSITRRMPLEVPRSGQGSNSLTVSMFCKLTICYCRDTAFIYGVLAQSC